MYIRRKVFSILDTEAGERLFSTTDYILDQREFTGETKRRNKALKRQWLEKLGEERMEEHLSTLSRPRTKASEVAALVADSEIRHKHIIDRNHGKGAGNVTLGRFKFVESPVSDKLDKLAANAEFKERNPELFKTYRKVEAMNNSMRSTLARDRMVPGASRPTNPEILSNLKPVIKTESKLSKLARIGKNFLKLKK